MLETMSCAHAGPFPRCTHWPSKGLGKHVGSGCSPQVRMMQTHMKDAGKNDSENVCRFTGIFRLQTYGRKIILQGRLPVQKSSQKTSADSQTFSSANPQMESYAPNPFSCSLLGGNRARGMVFGLQVSRRKTSANLQTCLLLFLHRKPTVKHDFCP